MIFSVTVWEIDQTRIKTSSVTSLGKVKKNKTAAYLMSKFVGPLNSRFEGLVTADFQLL